MKTMKVRAKITYEVDFDFDIPDCLVESYKLTNSTDIYNNILDIAYDAAPVPCDANGRPVYYESCVNEILDDNDRPFLYNF